MQIATNPLSQDEQFIIEANNAYSGEPITDVIDDVAEMDVADERIECIDAVGSDQALLVLASENADGLNHTVTVGRDEIAV
jgi:hypothetical protein